MFCLCQSQFSLIFNFFFHCRCWVEFTIVKLVGPC